MNLPNPIPSSRGCLVILMNPERKAHEVAIYDCYLWQGGRAWNTIVEAEDDARPSLSYLQSSLHVAPEDFDPVAPANNA